MRTSFPEFFHRSCALLVLAGVLSCSGGEEKKEANLVTFPLRGVVVKTDRDAMRISVAHEEIPNYMAAMTMPFRVKDTSVFAQVGVGDTISATLAVSRVESWLEGVSVVGPGEKATMTPEDVLFKRLYKEGEKLPEVSFVNQEGTTFTLGRLTGKVVVVTFVYTRCPLPDFCILMSNNFSKIQKALMRDASLAGKWHLVTVSFDPENDTPPVLKKYGRQYGADFSVWDFVTADQKTLQSFASGLDLYVEDGEGGLIDHNLRTALLDGRGRLVKVIKGNTWTAEDIVVEVRKLVEGEGTGS